MAWIILAVSAACNLVLLIQEMASASGTSVNGTSASGSGTGSIARLAPAFDDPDRGSAREQTAGQNLSACLERLPSLRAEVARLGQKIRDALPPNRIFQLGEPNVDAERDLQPILERALAPDGAPMPAYHFECRDVACRMTVIEDVDAQGGSWRMSLQKDSDLRKRVSSIAFHGSKPSYDLAKKTSVREEEVYFRILGANAKDGGSIF